MSDNGTPLRFEMVAPDRNPETDFSPAETNNGARTALKLIKLVWSEPRIWTFKELRSQLDLKADFLRRILNTTIEAGLICPAGRGYAPSDAAFILMRSCVKYLDEVEKRARREKSSTFYHAGLPDEA